MNQALAFIALGLAMLAGPSIVLRGDDVGLPIGLVLGVPLLVLGAGIVAITPRAERTIRLRPSH